MKSTILLTLILFAASNSDSCDTEGSAARENPDPQVHVQPTPAPTPEYAASQPAAEYLQQRPARAEGGK